MKEISFRQRIYHFLIQSLHNLLHHLTQLFSNLVCYRQVFYLAVLDTANFLINVTIIIASFSAMLEHIHRLKPGLTTERKRKLGEDLSQNSHTKRGRNHVKDMTTEECQVEWAKNANHQAILHRLKKLKKNSKYLMASSSDKEEMKEQLRTSILRKQ